MKMAIAIFILFLVLVAAFHHHQPPGPEGFVYNERPYPVSSAGFGFVKK